VQSSTCIDDAEARLAHVAVAPATASTWEASPGSTVIATAHAPREAIRPLPELSSDCQWGWRFGGTRWSPSWRPSPGSNPLGARAGHEDRRRTGQGRHRALSPASGSPGAFACLYDSAGEEPVPEEP
jgi:hypothetical protein